MFFFAPFFTMPLYSMAAIYILAAVLPAVFLMRYVYKQDRIEKEPPYLLWSLVGRGVLAALAAIVLELVAQAILDVTVDENDPRYIYIMAFLVVAVVEEGTKLFFLYRRTWNDPNFNYRFDGIVYAVFVSLGFAAFENVKYVFSYGLSVALPRALLAIPGHMGFSVFMGVFYGRARLRADLGDKVGTVLNLLAGYLSAVVLHGFYDSCCMIGTSRATVVFLIFVAVMYFVMFRLIKHESRNDRPV